MPDTFAAFTNRVRSHSPIWALLCHPVLLLPFGFAALAGFSFGGNLHIPGENWLGRSFGMDWTLSIWLMVGTLAWLLHRATSEVRLSTSHLARLLVGTAALSIVLILTYPAAVALRWQTIASEEAFHRVCQERLVNAAEERMGTAILLPDQALDCSDVVGGLRQAPATLVTPPASEVVDQPDCPCRHQGMTCLGPEPGEPAPNDLRRRGLGRLSAAERMDLHRARAFTGAVWNAWPDLASWVVDTAWNFLLLVALCAAVPMSTVSHGRFSHARIVFPAIAVWIASIFLDQSPALRIVLALTCVATPAIFGCFLWVRGRKAILHPQLMACSIMATAILLAPALRDQYAPFDNDDPTWRLATSIYVGCAVFLLCVVPLFGRIRR